MLDLKVLLDTHESVSKNRKAKGSQFCDEGYRQLSEAEKTGFQNKELLKQASQNFIQAIRQERTQAEAYIGLGYLLLLLSDFAAAEGQLKAALRLSPENPDARALLEYCLHKRLGGGAKPAAPAPRPAPEAGADPDQLYTQLQIEIHAAIQEWRQRTPLEPTLNAGQLTQLQSDREQLRTLWLRMDQDLNRLEHEMSTHSLRKLAQPLQSLLLRLEKIIRTSEKFQAIQQSLRTTLQAVQQSAVEIRDMSDAQQIQTFEQTTLEHYFDRCDHLADQLDELSNQGHDIRVLEGLYEELVAAIEQLHEHLDERLHQLNS